MKPEHAFIYSLICFAIVAAAILIVFNRPVPGG